MKLNEAGQGGSLAPTDSRIRPDIRYHTLSSPRPPLPPLIALRTWDEEKIACNVKKATEQIGIGNKWPKLKIIFLFFVPIVWFYFKKIPKKVREKQLQKIIQKLQT
jgi:hypothetical protein